MSIDFSDDYQDDSPSALYTEYIYLFGKLIYIVKAFSDIAYAVNRLATHADLATLRDYADLLRKQFGIRDTFQTYGRSPTEHPSCSVTLMRHMRHIKILSPIPDMYLVSVTQVTRASSAEPPDRQIHRSGKCGGSGGH